MKSPQEKLARIRAEIEALSAEREDIADGPIPRDEAVAKIAAVVDAPFSGVVLNPGSEFNARVDLDPAPAGLLDGSFSAVELMETLGRPGVIRAIFPNEIKAYLISAYDTSIGDAKPGLAATERRKRLAEIAAEIFALETEEEAVIEELEAGGADVLRRVDASPIAQLGLSPDAGEAA